MSIAWIAPAALIGLALIALPIAVHLLVRQHARTLAFPSLRFLRETQLAAFRRRTIQDAALLACRVAIIAAGGARARRARAADAVANGGLREAHVARDRPDRLERSGRDRHGCRRRIRICDVHAAAASADALADAVRWLDAQPPSSREIVVIGDVATRIDRRQRSAHVPPQIGIRFVPDRGVGACRTQTMSILTRRDGALVRVDRRVHLDADATRVSERRSIAGRHRSRDDRCAAARCGPLAEAALRAALDAGVPWSRLRSARRDRVGRR